MDVGDEREVDLEVIFFFGLGIIYSRIYGRRRTIGKEEDLVWDVLGLSVWWRTFWSG